jgi:hypothetical protein
MFTHFIEQVNYPDGLIKHISPQPITRFASAMEDNKKLHINTVAIFKVSEKPKPMLAEYDFNNKVTVIL